MTHPRVNLAPAIARGASSKDNANFSDPISNIKPVLEVLRPSYALPTP